MTAREPLSGLERIPVGFPLQDTTLHVLDEDLRQLPPGEIGELCVGGPGVALGYLGLAELTAQRFVSDPVDGARLYRTCDLARQLPSGAIEVLGRRDCQVKLRGFRIELAENRAVGDGHGSLRRRGRGKDRRGPDRLSRRLRAAVVVGRGQRLPDCAVGEAGRSGCPRT